MLSKAQKKEIDRLSDEGWNVSEICKQMKLDWKTVKRRISQRPQENMDLPSRDNNQLDENELSRVIFQKLNAGVLPDKIVEEIGHVDLVTNLYQKRKSLRGLDKSDSSVLDPQILTSFEAWEKSFQKYDDWHFKRAIRTVGEAAYQKMILCANRDNRDVECYQIENNDPYQCAGCFCFSGADIS